MLPGQGRAAPIVVADRRRIRIVWFGITLGLAGLVGAALLAVAAVAPAAESGRGVGIVFLLVAVPMTAIDLVLSFVVTGRMRRSPAAAASPEASAAAQTVVGSALAVGAALMCSVFFFVSREPALLLLLLPSAAVLLRWYPSEERWARILPASAPPAPQRQRMMRE
jgi:hypothetical protein